jgi:hypothetical protein
MFYRKRGVFLAVGWQSIVYRMTPMGAGEEIETLQAGALFHKCPVLTLIEGATWCPTMHAKETRR